MRIALQDKKEMGKREDRGRLAAQWRESGMSQKAFCEMHGIGITTLRYWLYKKKSVGFKELIRPDPKTELKEDSGLRGKEQLPWMTLIYPNGYGVEAALSLDQTAGLINPINRVFLGERRAVLSVRGYLRHAQKLSRAVRVGAYGDEPESCHGRGVCVFESESYAFKIAALGTGRFCALLQTPGERLFSTTENTGVGDQLCEFGVDDRRD